MITQVGTIFLVGNIKKSRGIFIVCDNLQKLKSPGRTFVVERLWADSSKTTFAELQSMFRRGKHIWGQSIENEIRQLEFESNLI